MIVKDIVLKNVKGKEFPMEVFINVSTVKEIEKALKAIDKNYTFHNCLEKIFKGEVTIIAIYVTCSLHKQNDWRAVDADFFDKNRINFFEYSAELVDDVIQCLQDMSPTKESNQAGKPSQTQN